MKEYPLRTDGVLIGCGFVVGVVVGAAGLGDGVLISGTTSSVRSFLEVLLPADQFLYLSLESH